MHDRVFQRVARRLRPQRRRPVLEPQARLAHVVSDARKHVKLHRYVHVRRRRQHDTLHRRERRRRLDRTQRLPRFVAVRQVVPWQRHRRHHVATHEPQPARPQVRRRQARRLLQHAWHIVVQARILRGVRVLLVRAVQGQHEITAAQRLRHAPDRRHVARRQRRQRRERRMRIARQSDLHARRRAGVLRRQHPRQHIVGTSAQLRVQIHERGIVLIQGRHIVPREMLRNHLVDRRRQPRPHTGGRLTQVRAVPTIQRRPQRQQQSRRKAAQVRRRTRKASLAQVRHAQVLHRRLVVRAPRV